MIHLFSFVLGIFNTVFRGFLIKTFWAWFIMTTFTSAPTLSVAAAIGLSCFVGAVSPWRTLTARDLDDTDRDDRGKLNLINGLAVTVAIVLSLGVGWVVHALM
jgi:hypothetical protein